MPSKPVSKEKLAQNTSKKAAEVITRGCRRTRSSLAPPTAMTRRRKRKRSSRIWWNLIKISMFT